MPPLLPRRGQRPRTLELRGPEPRRIEPAPGGCVYFGAGADGVYCLDAAGGKQRWHFPGPHVDAAPAVVGKRLYAGGAYGSPEAFCLDTTTGQPVWRTPCALSVLGPATVADGRAYFGLGNGKLNRSDPEPAGALLCLDADTGASLWRYDVADAVFGAAAIAGDRVFFGARDRHVYCLGCRDGRLLWRKDLGSAVTAAPVPAGVGLFTVTGGGSVFCLDPADGAVRWQFDLAKHSGSCPELTSAPALAALDARLYLGGGFHNSLTSAAVVYCLKYDR
jgi:outer membrane protein assembly factor BamB